MEWRRGESHAPGRSYQNIAQDALALLSLRAPECVPEASRSVGPPTRGPLRSQMTNERSGHAQAQMPTENAGDDRMNVTDQSLYHEMNDIVFNLCQYRSDIEALKRQNEELLKRMDQCERCSLAAKLLVDGIKRSVADVRQDPGLAGKGTPSIETDIRRGMRNDPAESTDNNSFSQQEPEQPIRLPPILPRGQPSTGDRPEPSQDAQADHRQAKTPENLSEDDLVQPSILGKDLAPALSTRSRARKMREAFNPSPQHGISKKKRNKKNAAKSLATKRIARSEVGILAGQSRVSKSRQTLQDLENSTTKKRLQIRSPSGARSTQDASDAVAARTRSASRRVSRSQSRDTESELIPSDDQDNYEPSVSCSSNSSESSKATTTSVAGDDSTSNVPGPSKLSGDPGPSVARPSPARKARKARPGTAFKQAQYNMMRSGPEYAPGPAGRRFKFQMNPRGIKEMWDEFMEGTNGNLSIKYLEKAYGTTWRTGPLRERRYASNYVGRRKKIVSLVNEICKKEGIEPEEACRRLDEKVDGRIQMMLDLVKKGKDPLKSMPPR